jgi:small subunit ribosomal protein S16
MSVKIRLARKGRKRQAYYHVVVADSRSPRDGRFIEKIGIYNPITDPATIDINFEKALGWLQNGAQPTDTCRAILKYKGVMMKKHLLEGVKKGAFDEAEADRRFNEWLKGKDEKIEMKKSGLEKLGEDARKRRLDAEKAIKEARAAEYAKKLAALAAEAEAAAKAAAAPAVVEAAVAEAPAEETAEAVAEVETTEAVAAEEPAEEAAAPEVAAAEAEAEAPEADTKEDTAEEKEKTE